MASSRRLLYPYSDSIPPVPEPKFLPLPDALPKPPIPINGQIPYSQRPSTHHQSVLILAIASVLAASFLLLSYYSFLLLLRRHHRRRRRALAQTPDVHPVIPGDEIHHVWYIRTVGLDESTIGSITICPYKKDEGLIDGTDCSVCLSEFGDGELVRLLPKCSHAFHISCIDTWLRSHVNCPLCRAPIVAPPVTFPVENTASSVVVEEGEGSESGIGSSSESVVEESPVPIPVRGRIDEGDSARWNSVRRSVSMDFSGRKEGSPMKVPFGIERSMSTTGNKFLMSRLGRVHSVSVLPL